MTLKKGCLRLVPKGYRAVAEAIMDKLGCKLKNKQGDQSFFSSVSIMVSCF
jgi:hypothetical protein